MIEPHSWFVSNRCILLFQYLPNAVCLFNLFNFISNQLMRLLRPNCLVSAFSPNEKPSIQSFLSLACTKGLINFWGCFNKSTVLAHSLGLYFVCDSSHVVLPLYLRNLLRVLRIDYLLHFFEFYDLPGLCGSNPERFLAAISIARVQTWFIPTDLLQFLHKLRIKQTSFIEVVLWSVWNNEDFHLLVRRVIPLISTKVKFFVVQEVYYFQKVLSFLCWHYIHSIIFSSVRFHSLI